MEKTIAVIRGDGIGPEIVNEALKVMEKVAEKYGHTFTYQDILAGGCAIDAYGRSLRDEDLKEELQQELQKTITEFGGVALLVSHNKSEIKKLCNEAYVIKQGQVAKASEI